MFKKIGDKLKNKFNSVREKALNWWTITKIGVMTTICTVSTTMMTYAANDYTKGINNLKTIFVTVIGAAGVVVLGYGGLKFAESFQKKDQNGEYSALYTVAAGAIMCGIDGIIIALAG